MILWSINLTGVRVSTLRAGGAYPPPPPPPGLKWPGQAAKQTGLWPGLHLQMAGPVQICFLRPCRCT